MEEKDRLKVLELLLWMTDRPLRCSDFQNILEEDSVPEEQLRNDMEKISKSLDERESPIQIMEIAKGFQMASRPAYSQWVRKLFKGKSTLRLSPSALETLSIIAYKQPITRGEIEEIRGVEVSGVVDTLLDRKLVKIIGRKEALGRPLLYGTTVDFMRQFGLKSLDELPKLDELIPPDEAIVPPEGTQEESVTENGGPSDDVQVGTAPTTEGQDTNNT